MSKQIKLIGTDFDLTLLYNGIPKATQDLLVETIQKGIKVGIVSGRPWYDMRTILTQQGINFGKPYPEFLVWREKFILWVADGKTREEVEWNKSKLREMEALNHHILQHAPDWLAALKEAGLEHRIWNIFGDHGLELFYRDLADAEKARKILAELAANVPGAAVSRNHCGTGVSLATGTKGCALRHVADCLGIAPNETLAIGDSLNDLSMLDGRHGLRSAAVANADPVVKEAVLKNRGLIAEKPGGAGVAEIIQKLV
jgi:HAD superfamily hydrolase (TIGR01484 family)